MTTALEFTDAGLVNGDEFRRRERPLGRDPGHPGGGSGAAFLACRRMPQFRQRASLALLDRLASCRGLSDSPGGCAGRRGHDRR
jgi:hypothetical protein